MFVGYADDGGAPAVEGYQVYTGDGVRDIYMKLVHRRQDAEEKQGGHGHLDLGVRLGLTRERAPVLWEYISGG